MDTSLFEDQRVEKRKDEQGQNQYSPYCDFIYYTSSRDPELRLAMKVIKPARPGYILAMTHGWHMSAEPFAYMEKPREDQPFLIVQVVCAVELFPRVSRIVTVMNCGMS